MPITTKDDLIEHLQTALQIEHATIPPYLCALYSIKDGTNTAIASVIRSVVMEEMLHMTLVANLLNAIGGHPDVNRPDFVPKYPAFLPHSADSFVIDLLPFTRQAVDTFLASEKPAPTDAKPEGDKYHTIAQFYAAVRDAFEELSKHEDLFTGKAGYQVNPRQWYYGGGGVALE